MWPKGYRPRLELGYDFSFFLNVGQIPTESTLSVAPGCDLRRATAAEVKAIQEVLTDFGRRKPPPWETDTLVEEHRTTPVPLPEGKWRYSVMTYENGLTLGEQRPLGALTYVEQALCVCLLDLKIGFTVVSDAQATGVLYHPGRFFSQVQALEYGALPFFDVPPGVIEDLKAQLFRIRSLCDDSLGLRSIIEQMLELDSLPYYSPLLFLGYFAILESLLTHKPKSTDTIDSITRQVKQKLILLDNRWEPKIDYSSFGGSRPETIWSKMYACRSWIAHGGELDFENDLKLLRSGDDALSLLTQTVKRVLRQALLEPQLIIDLRNC